MVARSTATETYCEPLTRNEEALRGIVLGEPVASRRGFWALGWRRICSSGF